MFAPPPYARNPFAMRDRHRPTVVATVGYLVFGIGTLLGFWLALHPLSDGSNPAQVLLLVWVIAGIAHILIRVFWRACVISAFASALGYIVLIFALIPSQIGNEMLGAGIIEVGLFGFLLSMLMGFPVVIYRRSCVAEEEEPRNESDPA